MVKVRMTFPPWIFCVMSPSLSLSIYISSLSYLNPPFTHRVRCFLLLGSTFPSLFLSDQRNKNIMRVMNRPIIKYLNIFVSLHYVPSRYITHGVIKKHVKDEKIGIHFLRLKASKGILRKVKKNQHAILTLRGSNRNFKKNGQLCPPAPLSNRDNFCIRNSRYIFFIYWYLVL